MIHSADHPLANYLRMAFILLAASGALAFLEYRFRVISRFLARKSTALNLAVTRIAIVLALFNEINIRQILTFTGLDAALLAPPKGWSFLAAAFPRSPHLAQAVYAVFLVSAVLAVIGLFGRWALMIVAAASFYLLTIPQLFGKIDHYHHLVIFCLLLALFPSCDTLSIDSLRKSMELADRSLMPRTAASTSYASGLNAILILMGLMYFFPGAWKVAGSWPHWFSSQNMEYLLYKRTLELQPTVLQISAMKMPLPMLLSTYAAVCFELGMIFLVLRERSRPFAIAMGLAFHNLTRLLMAIPFVALQCCYAALVDWTALLRFIAARLRLHPVTVIYEPRYKTCRRIVSVLSNLDWLSLLELLPNTQGGTLRGHSDIAPVLHSAGAKFAVLSEDGQLALGYDSFRFIASRIVPLWPVRLLLCADPVNRLGRAIYERAVLPQIPEAPGETAEVRSRVLEATVLPGAHQFAAMLVCAMLLLGAAHGVNCWPLACYPTFDGPFTLSVSKLTLQAAEQGGIADYTLSYDERMGNLLGPGRWDGLVQQQLRGKALNKPTSAALIRLWRREHAVGKIAYAVLSADNYALDLNTLTLKFMGRRQLETLSASDGL